MTKPITIFRITDQQRCNLIDHLFKSDGKESVALGLCGVHRSDNRIIFTLHEVISLPDVECSLRSPVAVRWPVATAIPLFDKAIRRRMAFIKLHSHPDGYNKFSSHDDESDATLSQALRHIGEGKACYLSGFMLPTGDISLRYYEGEDANRLVDRISIIGDEVRYLFTESANEQNAIFDDATLRTRQAFGSGTATILRNLCVGVVGCSGTGSWVVEMLARLGVGALVLVDPDIVERKNLNRIVNSTGEDAFHGSYKTLVLKRAIESFGFGTTVATYESDLDNGVAVRSLAECDFLFGCVDSADGRDSLNRIATYYIIPFIDVGVRLDADGKGGIRQITAAIHYLFPGGSSLLNRGVITAKQVADQALRRTQPDQFEALKAEGYVHGAPVDSPAVISINGFAASHAVNEMLARLHPFRVDDNSEYRHQAFSLVEGAWYRIPDDRGPCDYLVSKVGRGDCRPLIDNPSIT